MSQNDTTGSSSIKVLNRRQLLKVSGAGLVGTGLAGCAGGLGGGSGDIEMGLSIWGMFGAWEDAFVQSGRWYAADHDIGFQMSNALMEASKQVEDINRFIQQDKDAILVGPVSSTAPASAIEKAQDNDIPVATVNSDVDTDAVDIGVYYGNKQATAALAEEVVSYIKNDVDPEGEVSGTVLHLQGSLEMSIGQMRSAGIYEVFEGNETQKTDKYPDLNHIVESTNFQKEPGFEKTFNVLQSEEGEIDAIIGNSTSCRGAVEALQNYDMEKGDVFIAAHGGTPPDIQMVKDGWFQRAYEQPTHFYLPLAINYLQTAVQDGTDALPDIGSTVTSDDLTIEGEEHLGTNIWQEPTWAPADVVERWDHPWFRTNGRLITPENADSETIWGNLFGQPAA